MQFRLLRGVSKKKGEHSNKYMWITFLKVGLSTFLCSVCFGFTSISSTAKGLPDFCCQICIHNNLNGQETMYMQSWKGNLVFYLCTQHVKRNYIYRDVFQVFCRGKSYTVLLSKICYSRKMHMLFYRKLENCWRQHRSILHSCCNKFIGRLWIFMQVPNTHIIINMKKKMKTATSL